MSQPNFNIKNEAAIEATDFDNMTSEQIKALVNGAGSILNKRPGRLGTLTTPVAPKVVDLTQYLGGLDG